MRSNLALVLAASIALTGWFAPAVSSAPNDCQIPYAKDSQGNQVAPPCLDTGAAACQPGAPCPKRFYLLLLPERDGVLDNDGDATNGADDIEIDLRILWEEANACAGLQRTSFGGCGGADKPLF